MNVQQAKEEFLSIHRRASALGSAQALMGWDMETIIPPAGKAARAQAMGSLAGEAHRLTTGEGYEALLKTLEDAQCDATTQRMVQVARRDFDRENKIPTAVYEAFAEAAGLSQNAWEEARESDDFATFEPHLQKMIDFNLRFVDLWGYEEHPYNALMDGYEPGLRVAVVDDVFATLLAETRALLAKVTDSAPAQRVQLDEAVQKKIGTYLLEQIGFDMQAGSLFSSAHPFSTTIHVGDDRLTTHYREDQPDSSIFSILHEGGHGLLQQNIDPALGQSNLFHASMALHESQSRFWENIVGRSLAFWQTHLPAVEAIAGKSLAKDAQSYYRAVNRMGPSLVRVDADELTYNLHIIIRYEIEKAIATGSVKAKDLPALWNAKYEEYLGICPANDKEGVLQDVHWSHGSFGYFPTYALGNVYSAQVANALEKDLGKLDALIGAQGGIAQIKAWLVQKIYRGGAREETADVIRRVTGEGINPAHLLAYLGAKVADIYGK